MLLRERRTPNAQRPMPNQNGRARETDGRAAEMKNGRLSDLSLSRYVRRNVNRLFAVSHRRNRTSC